MSDFGIVFNKEKKVLMKPRVLKTSWYSVSWWWCYVFIAIFIPCCAKFRRVRTKKRVMRLRSAYLPHAAMATSNAKTVMPLMWYPLPLKVLLLRKWDILNSTGVTVLQATVSRCTVHCIFYRRHSKQQWCMMVTNFSVLISWGKQQPVKDTSHF